RTKVKGSKTIRYRCSLNSKLCQLGIRQGFIMTFLWGSTVTRLKLKGIDGRAPPGVEPVA
ncbi:hypothetical protein PPACK8108_LOCUS23618, partial [Phakopsora pachyrhizi]